MYLIPPQQTNNSSLDLTGVVKLSGSSDHHDTPLPVPAVMVTTAQVSQM